MSSGVRCEVCVESLRGARAAEAGGADRIELCMNLVLGGTTPSLGLVQLVQASISIPCMIMIRPRPGDFRYAEHELDCMLRDIELVKREGVYGVVLGALRGDGGIDYQATGRLIAAARPMSVTFHRAFDRTTDPHRALEQLMDLGCDRVLTSGQKPSAEEGILLLAELERQAIGQIVVMAGGGVTEKNALRILQATGVKEIHFSAREPTKVAAGDTARIEFSAADVNALWETSQQRVESIRSVVSRK